MQIVSLVLVQVQKSVDQLFGVIVFSQDFVYYSVCFIVGFVVGERLHSMDEVVGDVEFIFWLMIRSITKHPSRSYWLSVPLGC